MSTAPDFITKYITGMTSSPDVVIAGAGGTKIPSYCFTSKKLYSKKVLKK